MCVYIDFVWVKCKYIYVKNAILYILFSFALPLQDPMKLKYEFCGFLKFIF